MAVIRKGGVLTGQTLSQLCAGMGISGTAVAVKNHCNGDLNRYSIGDIARACLLSGNGTQDQLNEWNQAISEMLDPGNPAHLPATIQQTVRAIVVGCLAHSIPMAFEFNQVRRATWNITATPLPTPLHPTSWKFTVSGPAVPN